MCAQEIKAAQDLHAKAKDELNKLKSAETNNKKRREAVMKDMEKGVKDSQKRSNALRAELVSIKNKRDAILAEIKAINAELGTVKEQQLVSQAAVTRLTDELETLTTKVLPTKTRIFTSTNVR
jgi:chromosome segregation ATPase